MGVVSCFVTTITVLLEVLGMKFVTMILGLPKAWAENLAKGANL